MHLQSFFSILIQLCYAIKMYSIILQHNFWIFKKFHCNGFFGAQVFYVTTTHNDEGWICFVQFQKGKNYVSLLRHNRTDRLVSSLTYLFTCPVIYSSPQVSFSCKVSISELDNDTDIKHSLSYRRMRYAQITKL